MEVLEREKAEVESRLEEVVEVEVEDGEVEGLGEGDELEGWEEARRSA